MLKQRAWEKLSTAQATHSHWTYQIDKVYAVRSKITKF